MKKNNFREKRSKYVQFDNKYFLYSQLQPEYNVNDYQSWNFIPINKKNEIPRATIVRNQLQNGYIMVIRKKRIVRILKFQ